MPWRVKRAYPHHPPPNDAPGNTCVVVAGLIVLALLALVFGVWRSVN